MNSKINLALVLFACGAFILLFVIQVDPQGHHTWATWFFARVFLDTGEFPVPGRSPLQTLFISAFVPLGYPLGPTAMRFVDGLVYFSALIVLFRCYLSTYLSVFAALMWMPGLLIIEGSGIVYAVASLCWALAFRHGHPTRNRYAISYAFLVLCFMIRPNYILVLLAIATFDVVRFFYGKGSPKEILRFRPRLSHLPIAALLAALVVFSTQQSDHKWNGGYRTNSEWFGTEDRSLGAAAFIGSFVHYLILTKYEGDFDNNDIYFVAKNDLPDLKSSWDIFRYPDLLIGRIYTNKQLISIVARITDLGDLLFHAASRMGTHVLAYPVFYLLLLAGLRVFYRRHVGSNGRRTFYELIGVSALLTLPLLTAWPSSTYLYYFTPLLTFAGVGIGGWLAPYARKLPRAGRYLSPIALLAPVVLFSNFVSFSTPVIARAAQEASWQRAHLVPEIFAGRFHRIDELTANCRGIMMTSGYMALGTFSEKSVDRLHSIFEIPPFGRYGQSEYDGLRPERIDCVFVETTAVQRNAQTFTTKWSRYENYIVPYVDELKRKGAQTFEFGDNGEIQLTVLE